MEQKIQHRKAPLLIIIPGGDFILQRGDVISVVASRKLAREFLSHIGFETKQVKNTMIIGGGKAAYYLAKNLLDVGIDVKIIENNKERCEELSVLLPKAIIINGDGTDQECILRRLSLLHIQEYSYVSLHEVLQFQYHLIYCPLE